MISMNIKKLRTWVGRIKILNMYHVSLMVLPNSSYSQRVTARTQKFGEPHRYTRSSSRAWLVRPWPSPDRCGVQGYHMANLVTGVRRRVVAKVIKIDFQNAYERNGGEKCVLRNVFFFWKDIRKDLHFAIPMWIMCGCGCWPFFGYSQS